MKIERITIEINKANLDTLDGILEKIREAEVKYDKPSGITTVVDVIIK